MAQDIHSTDDCKLTFGTVLVTGFALSSFIKVTYDNPLTSFSPGADGKGTYVMSNQRSAKLELVLRRNAPANIALGAMITAALNRKYEAAGAPVFLTNLRTKTTYECKLGFLEKAPDFEMSNDAGNNTYTIICGEMNVVIGGVV